MNIFAEILLWLLWEVLLGLLIYPLAWLLATPVILIAACFREGAYWSKVRDHYRAVTDWCVCTAERWLWRRW